MTNGENSNTAKTAQVYSQCLDMAASKKVKFFPSLTGPWGS